MKQLRITGGKRRTWLLGLVLFVLCAVALGWGWYTTAAASGDQPAYEILNDEYDRILAPKDPAQGFWQELPAGPDTPLYGVRLNFSTYNKVVHGTLHAELTDAQGTVLARSACDLTTVLDNTFLGLVFDAPVFPEEEQTYRLHIYTEPAGPEDVIGLWAGNAQPGLALTDAADPSAPPASAALQYMVDYTGNVVARAYWVPALLLALAVLLGALLIARGAKAQTVFCAAGALLGVAFSLVTPPLTGPDEYAHAAASYALASQLTGQPTYDEEGRLYMRPCDAPLMTDRTGEASAFVYKAVAEHLLDGGNPNEATVPVKVSAPYTVVHPLYAAQTAGVTLARLLGLGFYGMLWLGRLANLAVYLLLGWFAVRTMPFAKELMFAAALLPMSLQLAASFSPDAFVLGICFALTALALRAASQEGPVTRGQLAGLVLLSAALGPCKAIYVVAVALCWMIPKEKFSNARSCWAFKLGCFAAALAGWLVYNFETVAYQFRDVTMKGLPVLAVLALLAVWGVRRAAARWGSSRAFRRGAVIALCLVLAGALALAGLGLLHVGGTLTPEEMAAAIQPNGESIYTFSLGYLLRNLPTAVRLVMNTVTEEAPLVLQEILGTRLSEPIVYKVEVSWIYSIGLVLVLLAASLRTAGEPRRLPGHRVWVCGGIFAAAAVLIVGACFTWTPINMQHLFGLQGRYFLPLLPLALLCIGENSAFCKTRSCEKGLRLAIIALTALVILQGLGLYAEMQPLPPL